MSKAVVDKDVWKEPSYNFHFHLQSSSQVH